jgi:hypothetical protein
MVGKVAIVGVVGNEDGPHKVVADLFRARNDIGYTIPAQGSTYWKRRGDAEQGLHRPRRGARSGGIRDRRSGTQRSPSDGRVQRRAIPPYE